MKTDMSSVLVRFQPDRTYQHVRFRLTHLSSVYTIAYTLSVISMESVLTPEKYLQKKPFFLGIINPKALTFTFEQNNSSSE